MKGRLAFVLLVTFARPLAAVAADSQAEGGTEVSYPHKGQIGIYSQIGIGYRFIARYDENDFCGKAGSAVCTGSTPPWIELGLSYGATNSLELITDVRIGLSTDFKPETSSASAPRNLVIAPGLKVYIDDEGSLKWFSTFQLAIDLTDYSSSTVKTKVDFGERSVIGLLIDLHRTFGVYIHGGVTFGFVRWFRFEMDGGVGLQARFP
ncbi:MAG TPA: hypothetical protein VKE22_07080 [Haliangiales bacterium]|nr:hypothetical protein [Haliangiales bacterium]